MKGQAILPILKLLELPERLKFELRHSWLSNGRRESVAEHAWQMALMAMVLHRHLEHQVDLEICVNVARHTRNRLPGRPRRFLACCLCTW